MTTNDNIKNIVKNGLGDYQAGFNPEIESIVIDKKGISEEVIRFISKKNNEPEDILNFRLDAFYKWQKMKEPHWALFDYPSIDYNDIYYFSRPKEKNPEVDAKIEQTYERLGIPLHERDILKGQAVDAVVDSVSVRTTYGKKLLELGIIFCPISVAIQKYPELVKKFFAKVVPPEDNFFACLNAAVFSSHVSGS